MAGVKEGEHVSHEMGMHTEQLAGRTQQVFFSPAEDENFVYPDAPDVDELRNALKVLQESKESRP